MSQLVLKPFNTTTRRYAAGDSLPPDADLAPHTLADLRQRHFVGDKPAARPAKGK